MLTIGKINVEVYHKSQRLSNAPRKIISGYPLPENFAKMIRCLSDLRERVLIILEVEGKVGSESFQALDFFVTFCGDGKK